ncbi:hypothetical protein NE865_13255 [Phthorimaea operculella]|nr:hypothetical protein NE865_13255 [Phthorimaea operculella]
MKIAAVVFLSCVLWEAKGYPYYPYYGSIDTLSYGASDSRHGGMVLNRYYNPYYTPQVGGGMAAFMFKQPEDAQPSQYYLADRRRQTPQDQNYPQQQQPNYPQDNIYPPQQENEVYYPVIPNKPTQPPTEATDIADPTGKTEIISTTVKTIVPELVEPEVEEVEEKPRKVSKKKQVKRPVQDEEEDDDAQVPKMPGGTFFPMFFGYGRNGGAPGGATAIANAYSTGRGGVATSHATAYGVPQPDLRSFKNYKNYQPQE